MEVLGMNVLVTGGAGYVGSHTVLELVRAGHKVTVLDNLQTGHKKAVNQQAVFIEGDVRDKKLLQQLFSNLEIDGVIHFAADTLAGESMKEPLNYFNNNVSGLVTLMNQFGVKHIVFSSSAAVYGETDADSLSETADLNPQNPYGESKVMMETIVEWSRKAYGIHYASLRYFNVAGAEMSGLIGEDHSPETHLIPVILEVASKKRASAKIFGNDYATPDGTTVRDFVHVVDIANAHILAMDYIVANDVSEIFNAGSSTGFSVYEIIKSVAHYTTIEIPFEYEARRAGDSKSLVASSQKIQEILNWQPQYTNLKDIIESAWKWHSLNPEGYGD